MITRSEKDGLIEWKFVNDETGKCEFTLAIPLKEFEDAAKVMVRIEREALEIEKQKAFLLNVPASVRSNILKITINIDKLTKEYYDHIEPMLKSIISMANIEAEISASCNSFWNALINNEKEGTATNHWTIANAKFIELKKIKDEYVKIAFDMTPQIELLQKRLQQLAEQIARINESTAPQAHKLYTKLYDTTKAGIETCVKYQAKVPLWEKTEGDLLDKAKEKFKFTKEMIAKAQSKPGNGAEESKEGEVQPLSPTRISPTPSSESKERSPNDSPNHSANNSPGNSLSRSASTSNPLKNDSPPLFPVFSDNAKLSSSPIAMYGNNSQAVQQQTQKLTVQYQQQPVIKSMRQGYATSE